MFFLAKRLRRASFSLGFCLAFAVGGCGESATTFVLVPIGPTQVALGETLQLTSTRPEVIWTVIGGSEKGSIDPFGLYTAPGSLPQDPMVTVLGQDEAEMAFAFIELTP